jgi:hypothetical protein
MDAMCVSSKSKLGCADILHLARQRPADVFWAPHQSKAKPRLGLALVAEGGAVQGLCLQDRTP